MPNQEEYEKEDQENVKLKEAETSSPASGNQFAIKISIAIGIVLFVAWMGGFLTAKMVQENINTIAAFGMGIFVIYFYFKTREKLKEWSSPTEIVYTVVNPLEEGNYFINYFLHKYGIVLAEDFEVHTEYMNTEQSIRPHAYHYIYNFHPELEANGEKFTSAYPSKSKKFLVVQNPYHYTANWHGLQRFGIIDAISNEEGTVSGAMYMPPKQQKNIEPVVKTHPVDIKIMTSVAKENKEDEEDD